MIAMSASVDVGFDRFVEFIEEQFGASAAGGRIVRDVFGRLSFVAPKTVLDGSLEAAIAAVPTDLKRHLAPRWAVSEASSPLAPPLLAENGLRIEGKQGIPYVLLDRRVAGDAWLSAPPEGESTVPRIAFYGLKGGVGRSTALAVCAADLALSGAAVLVLDLDLEAPGLESVLLRRDRMPDFGVLDWMASATAGLDALELVPDMIGGSPFTTGAGLVDVVPVAGSLTLARPETFLSKLARAYTPGAPSGEFVRKSFAEKIETLIKQLCERRRYDVILIDVRAGLHETSAASLLGLGASVLLFGTNSMHTFSGYSILLATIRQAMESWTNAPELRGRFKMVHGRASPNATDRSAFLTSSWQLWLDHLYDAADPAIDTEAFSFDLDDSGAPHFALTIQSSEAFLDFNPDKNPHLLTPSVYNGAYQEIIGYLRERISAKDER
jgi:cellulose biosynthesis protein BcsQ